MEKLPRDRSPDALGDLQHLPDELLCRIISLLAPKDVGSMACVSSIPYVFCNEEPLWMHLCLDNHEGLLEYKGSWKLTTLEKLGLVKNGTNTFDNAPLHSDGFTSLYLYRRWYRCHMALEAFIIPGVLERREKVTQEFTALYDGKRPFGKHAPALLQDYQVPYLFQEDFLALLGDQRPAFRWLVIGPARSGASWHVDPGLTSAWNTLLCGRKRWALYPPGRVPPQVTVHVDEEDGDVNFDGPSSLQWWVDVYPSLKDEDKPIECIQYPGETIYVPSGWWHCVLNIDPSVAVTQNVVNSANLELVCLDMAPGFRHKGVARAGGMALGQAPFAPTYRAVANSVRTAEAAVDGYTAQQRVGISVDDDDDDDEERLEERGCAPLDATLLLAHTQEHPDHFTSTSGGNYLGQRVLRRWLRKLWADRTDLRPRIWNCACTVLDAETWVHRAVCVCEAYGLPAPSGLERLPVGNWSNPVFVVGDKVIKFYVEEGPEGSVDVLGSELQFYAQVAENESPLQHAIPALVGSGILYPDGDKFRAVPWDGRGDIPRAHHVSSSGRKRGRDAAAAQEESEARVRTKWSRTGNSPDGAPVDAPQAGEQNSSNNSSSFLFCP